jgi:hypothetical protein
VVNGTPTFSFGSDYVYFNGWGSGVYAAQSAQAITDYGWHHVVGVKYAGDVWTVYVDGVRGSTGSGCPAGVSPLGSLRIGYTTTGGEVYAAEFAMFARALTGQEVGVLYRAALSPQRSSS